ncbi:hypothetical protein V8E51_003969 [Hyaloscypha variabilis]
MTMPVPAAWFDSATISTTATAAREWSDTNEDEKRIRNYSTGVEYTTTRGKESLKDFHIFFDFYTTFLSHQPPTTKAATTAATRSRRSHSIPKSTLHHASIHRKNGKLDIDNAPSASSHAPPFTTPRTPPSKQPQSAIPSSEIPSCKPLHSRPATPPSPPPQPLIGCAETSARKNAEAESPPIRGSFNDVIALAPQYWAATTKEGALFRRRFPLSAVHGIHLSKEEEGGRRPARALLANTDACTALRQHTHPSLHPSILRDVDESCFSCAWDGSWIRKYEKEIDAAPSVLVLPRACAYADTYFCFLHIQPPLLFHDSNTGFSYLIILSERASDLAHIHLHLVFFGFFNSCIKSLDEADVVFGGKGRDRREEGKAAGLHDVVTV